MGGLEYCQGKVRLVEVQVVKRNYGIKKCVFVVINEVVAGFGIDKLLNSRNIWFALFKQCVDMFG